ncbi:MAG TPA: MBL fold metallo-hydrolase, partial [Candidatus Hodarchaeales archaeon]|nr:MBL fold metallo-hydrolase [Candidatus Hodarchaeales archaeon]
DHIFLSHLHLDHWGGLRHLLTRALMFDWDFRVTQRRPIHVYVPKNSTSILVERARQKFGLDLNGSNNSAEFLKDWLEVDLGEGIGQLTEFHEVDPNQSPLLIDDYEISARFNRHIQGSVGYKVQHSAYKLNEEARTNLGIPKGYLLGRIQRNGREEYRGRVYTRDELFNRTRIGFGYSGDTPFDPDFIRWFSDVRLLVHESTYLEHDPSHHTDVHTVITDLIEEIANLADLKVFLPAHISQRYKWEDVERQIKALQERYPSILIYPPKGLDIIHSTSHDGQIISGLHGGRDKW